jgi:glycerol-3-phosphate dehydrogenase
LPLVVTHSLQLSGGATGDPGEYALLLAKQYPAVSEADIVDLVFKFGSNTPLILDAHLTKGISLLEAEWRYCADHEMALGVGDFIVRRLGKLYFDRPWIEANYLPIHEAMMTNNGTEQKVAEQLLEKFLEEYREVMAFEFR